MASFEIADFKGGLDTRRLAVKGVPGTARVLRDAHINRGAEIEKRKTFLARFSLPPGTFGCAASNGALYVFGPGANPGVPAGVLYQQLTPPGGFTMSKVLSVALFAGKLFVIVLYSNGAVRHFYNGVILTNYTLDANIQNARVALPFKSQMTLLYGSYLARSKIADPTSYNVGDTGAAFYDMSTQASGSETLTGVAEYQNTLAIFSRRAIQTWAFSADPTAAAKQQTLSRIGTLAPRGVVSVGGTDVFFLADSGIRSLRARDSLDTAAVQDVGTPVDDILTAALRGLTADQIEAVFAEIEPGSGRYWVTVNGITYVFSYFPGAGITAWSTYNLPAGAESMVVVDDRVYVRAGDVIFLYGGLDNNTFDATQVIVELPFVDGRSITTWKRWTGLDVACEGAWQVFGAFNPAQPDNDDLLTTFDGSSFFDLDDSLAGAGPMVKLRLVSVGSGAAKLSSVVLHYEPIASR